MTIYQNTSVIHDENLAHRLELTATGSLLEPMLCHSHVTVESTLCNRFIRVLPKFSPLHLGVPHNLVSLWCPSTMPLTETGGPLPVHAHLALKPCAFLHLFFLDTCYYLL